ncbi:MAG: hypothetical protein B6U73_05310 [Desulfurococcales archaeon ex4484_204]|nr:MAG: hypothetical protein B6U73_05310 [Desulfurococcales archaeon ex4484_204]
MSAWIWRRWRGRGRRPKPRFINWIVSNEIFFTPTPPPSPLPPGTIILHPDELEALRLVYLEGLSQAEAALRMGVSRGTLWRLLESGRKKLVRAIVESKPILIGITG